MHIVPALLDWLFNEEKIRKFVLVIHKWYGKILIFSLLITAGSILFVLRMDILSNIIFLLPDKIQSV